MNDPTCDLAASRRVGAVLVKPDSLAVVLGDQHPLPVPIPRRERHLDELRRSLGCDGRLAPTDETGADVGHTTRTPGLPGGRPSMLGNLLQLLLVGHGLGRPRLPQEEGARPIDVLFPEALPSCLDELERRGGTLVLPDVESADRDRLERPIVRTDHFRSPLPVGDLLQQIRRHLQPLESGGDVAGSCQLPEITSDLLDVARIHDPPREILELLCLRIEDSLRRRDASGLQVGLEVAEAPQRGTLLNHEVQLSDRIGEPLRRLRADHLQVTIGGTDAVGRILDLLVRTLAATLLSRERDDDFDRVHADLAGRRGQPIDLGFVGLDRPTNVGVGEFHAGSFESPEGSGGRHGAVLHVFLLCLHKRAGLVNELS